MQTRPATLISNVSGRLTLHRAIVSTHDLKGREHCHVRHSDPLAMCRYVAKLRKQLEDACADIFSSTDDRERIRSVLSDLSKTAADFKQIVTRAAESFVVGLMPRVR